MFSFPIEQWSKPLDQMVVRVSSHQNLGWLGCIGDEILPSYIYIYILS